MRRAMNVNKAAYQTIEVDVHNLPSTDTRKGSKGLGIFLTLFSLFWGGMPTAMLVVAILNGTFEPGMLMMLIFTTIGTALFLGGINQFFSVQTTRISKDDIRFFKKSLFGSKQWTEKMSTYTGVLSREEYHSGGKNQSSYTLYVVELVHPDKSKNIKLYESRHCPDLRKRWEDYSRSLGMPAVEMDGDKYVARDMEDLDKSVKELAQEGKLEVRFDPTQPPPDGLALEVAGEVLEVTVTKKQGNILGALIAFILPAVFIYVGFFRNDAPMVFGFVGIFFGVIMVLVIGWNMVARTQVLVGKDTVTTCWMTPWGRKFETTFNAAEIESVKVGRYQGQGPRTVVIATDTRTGKIGDGLKDDALEWLKQCILAVITK